MKAMMMVMKVMVEVNASHLSRTPAPPAVESSGEPPAPPEMVRIYTKYITIVITIVVSPNAFPLFLLDSKRNLGTFPTDT